MQTGAQWRAGLQGRGGALLQGVSLGEDESFLSTQAPRTPPPRWSERQRLSAGLQRSKTSFLPLPEQVGCCRTCSTLYPMSIYPLTLEPVPRFKTSFLPLPEQVDCCRTCFNHKPYGSMSQCPLALYPMQRSKTSFLLLPEQVACSCTCFTL